MESTIPGVMSDYRIFSVIRESFFPLPKQSQKSRFILQDRSRSLGLFRKGKTGITAKFHWTDLVIFSHCRERKTPSYSRRNRVSVCIKVIWTFMLRVSKYMGQLPQPCHCELDISKAQENMFIYLMACPNSRD